MNGFTIDLSQGSSDHNGKLETYNVAASHATLLAIGDVVTITGTATAADGVAEADAAEQDAPVTGVVAGFEPTFVGEALSQTGLAALTAGKARCHIDPNLNFIVPVSGGNLAAADVGLNADADVTAATKSGGLVVSNMALDSTTKAATATLQFRIVGIAANESGEFDGSFARVRFNNSTLSTGSAGV
jgi:uncharacterized protein YigE (DUF2233 family)